MPIVLPPFFHASPDRISRQTRIRRETHYFHRLLTHGRLPGNHACHAMKSISTGLFIRVKYNVSLKESPMRASINCRRSFLGHVFPARLKYRSLGAFNAFSLVHSLCIIDCFNLLIIHITVMCGCDFLLEHDKRDYKHYLLPVSSAGTHRWRRWHTYIRKHYDSPLFQYLPA